MQVADLLEFQNANPFRVRAYRNGARTRPRSARAGRGDRADPDRKLTDIAGIGKDLADKIATLVDDRQAADARRAAGRGAAQRAGAAAHSRPGPEEGRRAVQGAEASRRSTSCEPPARRSSVRELKGFGAKTEETILAGIALAATADERMLLGRGRR